MSQPQRMSAVEYREKLKGQLAARAKPKGRPGTIQFGQKRSTSKYGNIKVIDPATGIKFDSKAEHKYYVQLKLRERAGEVTEIELQPIFWLTEARGRAGTKYKADFRFKDVKTGQTHVIDVKGGMATQTPMFRDKMKQMRERHPSVTVEIVSK